MIVHFSFLIFIFFPQEQAFAKKIKSKIKPALLYFQPLQEFNEETRIQYFVEIQEALQMAQTPSLIALLVINHQNDCPKTKKRCDPLIYHHKKCLPEMRHPGEFCKKSTKTTSRFFEESVFNRLSWNKKAIEINKDCLKSNEISCQNLSKIRKKYEKIFFDLRKKEKKEISDHQKFN